MYKLYVLIIFLVTQIMISYGYAGDFSQIEEELSVKSDPMQSVGFKADTSWTNWNKFWFAGAVVGNTLDTTSTIDALDRGCIESNPLLGEQPSDLFLVGFKVGVMGISWLLVENLSKDENVQMNRNVVYGFQTVLMNAMAVSNYNLECN